MMYQKGGLFLMPDGSTKDSFVWVSSLALGHVTVLGSSQNSFFPHLLRTASQSDSGCPEFICFDARPGTSSRFFKPYLCSSCWPLFSLYYIFHFRIHFFLFNPLLVRNVLLLTCGSYSFSIEAFSSSLHCVGFLIPFLTVFDVLNNVFSTWHSLYTHVKGH